jgi:hypothetical protein
MRATAILACVLPFVSLPGCESYPAPALSIVESDDAIVIRSGGAHVLTYHKAEVPPPAGSSPLYRRSGFIHPLTAPNGGVVTGIRPEDHQHHLGLWHAWVKTTHEGRDVDFWNLLKGEGTVRYARTEAIRRSPSGVGFTVIQQHVILPDEVVLDERFSIDVHVDPDGGYVVDHVTEQENVSDSPLTLPAYRYGGCIALRGPECWNEHNSDYLTSEGRSRIDGHATRARWCAMYGETDQGVATVTILGHPDNHDAPQRQRIWPATPQNRGAIFFNFVPTQETDWALEPGEPITMRYRVVVSDGRPDRNQIDEWFDRYVQ